MAHASLGGLSFIFATGVSVRLACPRARCQIPLLVGIAFAQRPVKGHTRVHYTKYPHFSLAACLCDCTAHICFAVTYAVYPAFVRLGGSCCVSVYIARDPAVLAASCNNSLQCLLPTYGGIQANSSTAAKPNQTCWVMISGYRRLRAAPPTQRKEREVAANGRKKRTLRNLRKRRSGRVQIWQASSDMHEADGCILSGVAELELQYCPWRFQQGHQTTAKQLQYSLHSQLGPPW
jgi:hypothetical protein